jgi:hypothetical protein
MRPGHPKVAKARQWIAMAIEQNPSDFRALVLSLVFLLALPATMKAEQRPVSPTGSGCVARLAGKGIEAVDATLPAAAENPLCVIEFPVVLISVADAALPTRRIRFPDKPVLACAMAERLAAYTSDIVAPFALGVYGKELVAISTGPGYECRPRNRQAGAKISSHGQGNAVDIMSVEIQGGRKVAIERPDGLDSVRFIAGIRASACGHFSTVLGPGSDASHGNHLHLDIEKRGANGVSKFCQ